MSAGIAHVRSPRVQQCSSMCLSSCHAMGSSSHPLQPRQCATGTPPLQLLSEVLQARVAFGELSLEELAGGLHPVGGPPPHTPAPGWACLAAAAAALPRSPSVDESSGGGAWQYDTEEGAMVRLRARRASADAPLLQQGPPGVNLVEGAGAGLDPAGGLAKP